MIGGTTTGGTTYYGSSNISNFMLAQRSGGVCSGSLWQSREVKDGSGISSSSLLSWGLGIGSMTEKIHTYAILVGTCLMSYDSYNAYERGDMPISTMTIVGASAGSFTTTTVIRRLASKATGASSSSSSSSNSTATTTPGSSGSASLDFRVVSDQGTHVHCQPCSTFCRRVWLDAFQSGIEGALLEQATTMTSNRHSKMIPPSIPDVCNPKINRMDTSSSGSLRSTLIRGLNISVSKLPRYCISCGAVEMGSGSSSNVCTVATPQSESTTTTTEQVLNDAPDRKVTRQGSSSSSKTTAALASAVSAAMTGSVIETDSVNSTTLTSSIQRPTRTVSSLAHGFSTPITQYGKELRCDVCFHCSVTQGLVDYMDFCSSLLEYRIREKKNLRLASKACWKSIYDTYTRQLHEQQEAKTQTGQDLNEEESATSEEKLNDNNDTGEKNGAIDTNDDATHKRNTPVETDVQQITFDEYFTVRWQHPIPENTTTSLTALMKLSKEFTSYRKQSAMLQSLYDDFFDGRSSGDGATSSCISVVEFLESLDEMAGYSINAERDAIAELKKQAFRVAGDMGTAMRLLLELALTGPERGRQNTAWGYYTSINNYLPSDIDRRAISPTVSGGASSVTSPRSGNSTRLLSSTAPSLQRLVSSVDPFDTGMLSCVLEFFLDLCDRGDIATVAFYWPQLCLIHLQMLPAKNAMELARIDLMEDFLLTVSTQYSVHLALELTWMHTADLEESVIMASGVTSPQPSNGSSNSSAGTTGTASNANESYQVQPKCRQRRFAVLRFICELESMLFDEAGTRWGLSSSATTRKFVGGSGIALGSMLSPTPHQAELLQQASANIQLLRNQIIESSVVTVLIENSGSTARESVSASSSLSLSSWYEKKRRSFHSLPPDLQVAEKLRIVRNADYYTCHLNFSKRLSDIAEKLRHTELDCRSTLLQQELDILNASGLMGGDPLNRVLTDGLIRAVRIPSTEGHVFRSKERTPVLLLVEALDESVEIDNDEFGNEVTALSNNKIVSDPTNEMDTNCESPSNSVAEEKIDEDEDIDTLKIDSTDDATSPLHPSSPRQECPSVIELALANDSTDNAHEAPIHSSEPKISMNGCVESGSFSSTSPRRPRLVSDQLDILEGASSDSRPSPRPAALKRFDNRVENTHTHTPKRDVEIMVHAVVEHQLSELSMPILNRPMPPEPFLAKLSSDEQTNVSNVDKMPQAIKVMTLNTSSHDTNRSSKRLTTIVSQSSDSGESSAAIFAPTGDVRREVLTTIMMRGIQGNTIAAGAADSVQLTLKDLGRKRATELLMKDDDGERTQNGSPDKDRGDGHISDTPTTRQKMESLGLSPVASTEEEELAARPSEEDEIMEAIRLILIQNRVAQGKLSPADAEKVLQYSSLSPSNYSFSNGRKTGSLNGEKFDASEHPTIDAGDVDPRLVGCGVLPPAILQAMTLWKAEMVSNAELLELVKKDVEFVKHSVLVNVESVDALKENSAFWGRFAFGERWAEKKARIGSSSPKGSLPGWDLLGVIVKSNDDLRQEAFVMQLIELSKEAFELAGLELWISPYRILATGRSTGVIECVRNAMSFDALKKRPGYGKGGLREHLLRMTEFTADPGETFKTAQRNFVRSLAAYSLLSYFFLIKDRHNGNLLLDTAGHVIHIDFGFVFGIAPGGSFSLEMSTPFKLTEEMLDVMGGLRSPLFSEFVTLFCCGFLTMQSYCDTFLALVEITCAGSTFKCFEGRDSNEILTKMRERFCPDMNKEETVTYALDLIKQATTSYGTRQYDIFQYISQGIVA